MAPDNNRKPPTTESLLAKFEAEAAGRLEVSLPTTDTLADQDAAILREREDRDNETSEKRAARVPKLGSGAVAGTVDQPHQRFSLRPPSLNLPS